MNANAKRSPEPVAPAATTESSLPAERPARGGKPSRQTRAAADIAERSPPAIQLPGLIDPHDLSADRQFSMNLARGLQVLRAFTASEPVLGNR